MVSLATTSADYPRLLRPFGNQVRRHATYYFSQRQVPPLLRDFWE